MAKDRRDKARPKMDLETDTKRRPTGTGSSRSSSSSSKSAGTAKKKAPATRVRTGATGSAPVKKRKKQKLSRAALIIRIVLAILILTVLFFGYLLATTLVNEMIVDSGAKNAAITPYLHEKTDTAINSKVAYYVVGLLGEGEDDDTQMMSVVCHDKEKNTVSILELPNQTYIGKTPGWSVTTVDGIFASPKQLDWCDKCRARVYEPAVQLNGETRIHKDCATPLTKREGSATGSIADFVNDQLGLPVDEWFMLRPATLKELVGYVGGVDISLGGSYVLDGNAYEAGVHTLSGSEVMEYLMSDSIDQNTRFIRQREVFSAVLFRIFRMGRESGFTTVREDVIGELMSGQNPIISGIKSSNTEEKVKNITAVLQSLSKANVDNMTLYTLPCVQAIDPNDNASVVFAAQKDALLTLLNQSFVPYSAKLTVADLAIPELSGTQAFTAEARALKASMEPQTGKRLDETSQATSQQQSPDTE